MTASAALQNLISLAEIEDRLEGVLKRSTADETELVWLETERGEARNRQKRAEIRPHFERTILVRVIDRRRVGSHRTGTCDSGELDTAVRAAIAQSRSREPLPGLPHLPAENEPTKVRGTLWDSQIADLDANRVREMYKPWLGRRGTIRFDWTKSHVAVFNSRGIRRTAAVTTAEIDAHIGRRPGGGRAAAAARVLDALAPSSVVERAHRRHASGEAADPPAGPVPVVLSQEATVQLCDLLNRVAFSAVTYYHGSSFLRQHLGVQVFDRAFNLRDDGTDSTGIAFPFDLEGTAKVPVDLILKGTPKTPALDQRQAAQLGLTPTAHAIGGNDARAMNLFVQPGTLSRQELLHLADGGLWVGWLDGVECFEPERVLIRAHARGVRRIADGELAEGIPDLLWEDGMLRALSNLLGVGTERVLRTSHDGFLGGICAPMIAIAEVSSLRPAEA